MPVYYYQHCSVWTSISLSHTQKSNFLHFLTTFGLLLAFLQLQSPIHCFFLLDLDFCTLSHRFKVQSATFPRSVWTFSHCLTSSRTNPPHFCTSFGLPPASSPLQGPIRHTLALRLDFLRVSHCFQVQSDTLKCTPYSGHAYMKLFT